MKRLPKGIRFDRWQKALIEKSERLRRQGVHRTATTNEEDVQAQAATGVQRPHMLARWTRRLAASTSDEEDAPSPRRSRRKGADALQASGLDYQHALQVQWWDYRYKFLEAMRLDLEIRSEDTT